MTELETLQRAKRYIDQLARGIDPISNQEVPEDSVLNQVQIARCFYYVSDILEQVIDNGGTVVGKGKGLPFTITAEQLSKVQTSPEPLCITQLVNAINVVVENEQMKKLRTTVITDWLLEKGFLVKRSGPDGEAHRLPTQLGKSLGMSTRLRRGKRGEYEAVLYNPAAQQFILEHLPEILNRE